MKKLVLLLTFLPCLTSFGQGFKVYKSDGKVDAYPGETVKSVTLNDDSLHYAGHEYVDLGLPSGTRWATTNVGADKDYQNGLHFSLQRAGSEGLWGGDWHLPSVAECQELQTTCLWEWTTVMNSQGYRVTGPNGNSIFLPAAGHIGADGSFVGGLTGQMGCYWTSDGYNFAFSPQTKGLADNNPAMQLSLRPVIGGQAIPNNRSELVQEGEHDYVDLGLSVLWATTNIGAATPEDFGDYFGPCISEPMPADFQSLSYNEQEQWFRSHSPIYKNNSMAVSSYMYDYYYLQGREEAYKAWEIESKQMNRMETNKMGYWILPQHDAASVCWGDGWRMPTLAEYKELIENTTKLSNIPNTVLQAANGNTITLPTAGSYSISGGQWQSSNSYYLTSSIYENGPIAFLSRSTASRLQYDSYLSNQYFLPVRPVKDRPRKGLTDEATIAQQEMVDLGLSVLWANCNWGAATPKDKGEYVAWGETTPKAAYTNAGYHLTSYSQKSCLAMFGKTGWTLPTAAEMQELIEKCTWAREADGYRVTGPNGNNIFLPYTGFREGPALTYPNETGFYWTTDTLQALRLDETGTPALKEATGYFGMAVRPVMDPAIPETGDVFILDHHLWNAVSIPLKARGDFMEAGIQYSYFRDMDNPRLNVWWSAAHETNEEDVYQVSYPHVQPNTTYYYRAFVRKEDGTTLFGDTKEFHTTANIPAVDLGLSVKWASVNLGAAYEYDTKDWYLHPSVYGTADQLPGILTGNYGNSYVETTYWPDEWRIPTEAEFQELLDKCTWEWQEGDTIDWTKNYEQDNRNGYKVTGPNGNSIFLPANGIANGYMTPLATGVTGNYWTQTPSEKYSGYYKVFGFSATEKKFTYRFSESMYNIRPVKK